MKPGREWFGQALAATAGMALGYAWTERDTGFWWVGALSFLSAALFVLSAVYLVRARQQAFHLRMAAERRLRRSAAAVPPPPPPVLTRPASTWRSREGR